MVVLGVFFITPPAPRSSKLLSLTLVALHCIACMLYTSAMYAPYKDLRRLSHRSVIFYWSSFWMACPLLTDTNSLPPSKRQCGYSVLINIHHAFSYCMAFLLPSHTSSKPHFFILPPREVNWIIVSPILCLCLWFVFYTLQIFVYPSFAWRSQKLGNSALNPPNKCPARPKKKKIFLET